MFFLDGDETLRFDARRLRNALLRTLEKTYEATRLEETRDIMNTILYMAPMQGVTNCIYREAYFRHFKGYDLAVSPLIAECNATDLNTRVFKELKPELNNPDVELIPQILGNEAADFIQMSKLLFKLGLKKVNWNLGCPFPMVRNKKRGSGLLPHPEMIVKFLEQVIPAVPNKVSIKVRLGVSDAGELYRLLPMLNGLALENIIIHPRTAEQMYEGHVDLDGFQRALALTKHEVVYSGDIYTLKDFQELSARFSQIDRWMLGRGGVIDPFLAERIKNLDTGTQPAERERFKSFHAAIFESYRHKLCGPSHLLHKMKELWTYWALSFEDSRGTLKKILKTKTVPRYQDTVKKLFDL